MSDIEVETLPCPYCGEVSYLTVDEDALTEWRNGAYIQVSFPNLSPSDRELLITGTHPDCWEKMFSEEDEDDEVIEE